RDGPGRPPPRRRALLLVVDRRTHALGRGYVGLRAGDQLVAASPAGRTVGRLSAQCRARLGVTPAARPAPRAGPLASGGTPHHQRGSRSPAPAARIHNITTKSGEC